MIVGRIIPGLNPESGSTFEPLGQEEVGLLRPNSEEERSALIKRYKGISLVTEENMAKTAAFFQIDLEVVEEADIFAMAEIMEMFRKSNHRKKLTDNEPDLVRWIERSNPSLLSSLWL